MKQVRPVPVPGWANLRPAVTNSRGHAIGKRIFDDARQVWWIVLRRSVLALGRAPWNATA